MDSGQRRCPSNTFSESSTSTFMRLSHLLGATLGEDDRRRLSQRTNRPARPVPAYGGDDEEPLA